MEQLIIFTFGLRVCTATHPDQPNMSDNARGRKLHLANKGDETFHFREEKLLTLCNMLVCETMTETTVKNTVYEDVERQCKNCINRARSFTKGFSPTQDTKRDYLLPKHIDFGDFIERETLAGPVVVRCPATRFYAADRFFLFTRGEDGSVQKTKSCTQLVELIETEPIAGYKKPYINESLLDQLHILSPTSIALKHYDNPKAC